MNLKWKVLSLLLGLSFLLHFAGKEEQRPIEAVQAQYQAGLRAFQSSIKDFRSDFRAFRQGELEQAELQASFAKMRLAFKEIEFILDYLEPQDVKDHLNGAPLPKTERNAPRMVIMEPKGLQVIEELVYDEALGQAPEALAGLIKDLDYQFKAIQAIGQKQRISDRQVFEAARLGIIRLITMGITGFDTPSSDQAIVESGEVMSAIHLALKPYLRLSTNRTLKDSIEAKFAGAQEFLAAHTDFESFDRLTFIRDYAEPLFGLLLDLHLDLQYETAEEVFRGQLSFNYRSRHLFSAEFFNLQYYTGLVADETLKAKQELGRYLFFDPVLSANYERSCASCHDPALAYTDGRAKSLAFDFKGEVKRNAPSLYNALYSEKFFYDLRADRMESQMEHVIFSPQEFAHNYRGIFTRLEDSEAYQALFQKAFPDFKGAINRHTLSQAIVAFLSELSSFDTELDRYLRGESAAIAPRIARGFNLFMGKAACATCHFAPTYSGLVPPWYLENESEVLGVLESPDSENLDLDLGRYAGGVVQDEAPFFKHSFKTPTVRNVALSGPYFHNGAYPDLRSVLDFYNHGGAVGLGLDLSNQTLPGDSLFLLEEELLDLEYFLRALTDTSRRVDAPKELPLIENKAAELRLIGGKY